MATWARSVGTYLGRYVVDKGKAVHTSKTCIVQLATDCTKTEKDVHYRVPYAS